MNATTLFSFGNTFVLLGWLFLLFLPNWKLTKPLILSAIILILAVLYSFLILKDIGNFKPDSFSTLANVKALFQNDNALAAGWLHYLAFDLLVGTYIVNDAQKHQISRWFYTIPLPFTFMFGPLGYLIYFVIKTIKTKTLK